MSNSKIRRRRQRRHLAATKRAQAQFWLSVGADIQALGGTSEVYRKFVSGAPLPPAVRGVLKWLNFGVPGGIRDSRLPARDRSL